jgi:release factor glutamine methyltransferase
VPTDEIRLLATDVRRHEPRLALDGGAGGLRLVRRMLPAAAGVLRPGGRLFLEVGGAQDAAVARMLAGCGFRGVESWCDEDGELRGMSAELGRG